MEYMYPNDAATNKKRADEKTSSGIPQDGKAYKLIKLNYDIVIIVRIADPELLPLRVLTEYNQVDDSVSMSIGAPISRWQECSEAISVIAEAALEFDSGGIDIHFLNSPNSRTCKVMIFPRKQANISLWRVADRCRGSRAVPIRHRPW